jgi:hypothetical protein
MVKVSGGLLDHVWVWQERGEGVTLHTADVALDESD